MPNKLGKTYCQFTNTLVPNDRYFPKAKPMPEEDILRRLLHTKIAGASDANEDWWHLAYDKVSHDLYVEHSWHHAFKGSGIGQERIELAGFLKSSNPAASKLQQLLRRLIVEN